MKREFAIYLIEEQECKTVEHGLLEEVEEGEYRLETVDVPDRDDKEHVFYNCFLFLNGDAPVVTCSYDALLKIIFEYELRQVGENAFYVLQEISTGFKDNRSEQGAIDDFAITWQRQFECFSYGWGELQAWKEFFEYAGEKYDLLEDFQENGIL